MSNGILITLEINKKRLVDNKSKKIIIYKHSTNRYPTSSSSPPQMLPQADF